MMWKKCRKVFEDFDLNYSLGDDERKILFYIANSLPIGSNILEVGIANGRTAAMLSCVATNNGLNYYGIDPWFLNDGEPVKKKLDEHSLKYTLFETVSANVNFDKPLHLLFIDGGHDEANVSVDCDKFIPLVVKGGYVAFDDYEDPYNPDSPHKAVRLNADRHTEAWVYCGHYGGRLLIRRKL